MNPKDWQDAASIIRAIAAGGWSMELPDWVHGPIDDIQADANLVTSQVRAIQTAEAFTILGQIFDPTFDEVAFLRDCGLVD